MDCIDRIRTRSLRVDLLKMLDRDEQFRQAVLIARKNSGDGIWLIGGSVFRRLAHLLYGTPMPDEVDFDFLVGWLYSDLNIPSDWKPEFNAFGNPKLIKDGVKVDLCPLARVHSIVRRQLEPTIENWMTGTPLNIQSVMLDCNTGELKGDIGLNAIFAKVVAVNDPIQAEVYAGRKKKTVERIICEKAAELNFSFVLRDK